LSALNSLRPLLLVNSLRPLLLHSSMSSCSTTAPACTRHWATGRQCRQSGITKPSGLYPDYPSVECGAVHSDPFLLFGPPFLNPLFCPLFLVRGTSPLESRAKRPIPPEGDSLSPRDRYVIACFCPRRGMVDGRTRAGGVSPEVGRHF